VVYLAIIPRRVLFPIPEPAIIAILCPLPIVKRALISLYLNI